MNWFNFNASYDSRGLNAVIWIPVVFALLVVMLPKGDNTGSGG